MGLTVGWLEGRQSRQVGLTVGWLEGRQSRWRGLPLLWKLQERQVEVERRAS